MGMCSNTHVYPGIPGDLDNSTNNDLIQLDSWTSGLIVYRFPLSGLIEKQQLKGEKKGSEKKEELQIKKEGYATSTNRVSIVSPSVSAAGQIFDNVDDLPTDPLMPDLEDTADLLNTGIFSGAYNDKDKGAKADLNNLETTMNVSPIPITRIHKDHPKDQIIGYINSTTQTRRMTKITEEHALKVIQALDDPSWIEAMQDELLQFKLQKVWTLVDLPNGKRALEPNGIELTEMHDRDFQMSSMWELTFFLGLQVKHKDDGIFISQDKYVADILKKFDFAIVKTSSTPIETNKALLRNDEASRYLKGQPKLGLWYPRDSPFDLEAFSDSDYAGASLDRKSMT
ncbi:hypothetical protein Tco_0944053 [Tanacetum coccineum]